MAYNYAYKPQTRSYSDVGYSRSRKAREEERRMLLDDEDTLWDTGYQRTPSVLSNRSKQYHGHYGTVDPGGEKYRQTKAKTLLSVGDGVRADLSFENINVHSIPKTSSWLGAQPEDDLARSTQLLNDVNGIVRSGEVMAVMGASGAGKSTLMNVLTNRNLSNNLLINGSVKVNGVDLGSGISKISGYVQQDDLFFPTLTVREHLQFQAALKIGNLLSKHEREQRVEELLRLMGLWKCGETRIGVPGVEKSISGGESKRLAFATELIVNPAILFCDEPTTGLDSFMAEQVVNVLRQLAQQGKTIVCVIHQPSSAVFNMFTKLLLLAEGRVAYHGSSAGALDFFAGLGYPCPESYNPAEHYIKTLASVGGQVAVCREKVNAICDAFEQSPTAAELRRDLDIVAAREAQNRSVLLFDDTSNYRVSMWMQFQWLLWRTWLDNIRNPDMFRVRTVQKMVIAFIYGIIYLHGVQRTQEGIQNTNGALFLYMTENSFAPMLDLVTVFQRGVPLLQREYAAYLYRLPIFYVSQIIGWLPSFAVDAAVFCIITYFMVGLVPDISKFLITFAICIITANVAAASGSLVSTISPSLNVGLVVAPTVTVVVMLFGGGVYLKLRTVPYFLSWLQWFSWFRYGNEILAIVHWEGVRNITCGGNSNTTCISTGEEVLEDNNYYPGKLGFDIGMLGVLFAGFHLLAYLFLYLRHRHR